MSDDPNDSSELERLALDIVLAYLAGQTSLDAAVIAVRSLAELPAIDGDVGEAEDAEDTMLGFDLSGMPAEQRARYEALSVALNEAYPDTK